MQQVAAPWVGALAMILAYTSIPSSSQAQTAPSLSPGFHASVYAQGLTTPTAISVGPDGRLYIAQQNGTILAIGKSGATSISSGFATPLGLAWQGHTLYVSSTGQVSALTPSKGYSTFSCRVIISGLPNGKHQHDGMAFRGGLTAAVRATDVLRLRRREQTQCPSSITFWYTG